MNLAIYQNKAVEAVRHGGEIAYQIRSTGDLGITIKPDGSPVTRADMEVEKSIKETLLSCFPDHGFTSEESDALMGTEPYRWSLDPIDGTRSYINGEKNCAISLSLHHTSEGIERVVLGMVYNFLTDELYCAREDNEPELIHGSRLIQLPRHSPVALNQAVFNYFVPRSTPEQAHKLLDLFKRSIIRKLVCNGGSAAYNLAQIAEGCPQLFLGVTLPTHGAREWDIAAGVYLVRKTKGMVGISQDKTTIFATSTPSLYNEMESHLISTGFLTDARFLKKLDII